MALFPSTPAGQHSRQRRPTWTSYHRRLAGSRLLVLAPARATWHCVKLLLSRQSGKIVASSQPMMQRNNLSLPGSDRGRSSLPISRAGAQSPIPVSIACLRSTAGLIAFTQTLPPMSTILRLRAMLNAYPPNRSVRVTSMRRNAASQRSRVFKS